MSARSSSISRDETPNGSALYEAHSRRLEGLGGSDVDFEAVAEAVDDSELLAPDQKAALWLLAYSLLGPDAKRSGMKPLAIEVERWVG